MEPLAPINISFLKRENLLDDFILSAAKQDGKTDQLTFEEVRHTLKNKYPKLFPWIRPEDCFRDLRAYLVLKGLSLVNSISYSHDIGAWLSYHFLVGSYNKTFIGDILGAHIISDKDARIFKLIGKKLYFTTEKTLMKNFEHLSRRISKHHLLHLLSNSNKFTKSRMEDSVLTIMDRLKEKLKKEGAIDRKKIAEACVEILLKRSDLFGEVVHGVSKVKSKFDEIWAMKDPAYVWKEMIRGPEKEEKHLLKFFHSRLKDATFGTRLIHKMPAIGTLDTALVKKFAAIIFNDRYDIVTRASIAWALGEIKYTGTDAKKEAADILSRFLKGLKKGVWAKKNISLVVYEAVISLGKLGIIKTNNHNIHEIIAFYLHHTGNPFLRFAGARAFSHLVQIAAVGSREFTYIRHSLASRLEMDDEDLILRVAAIAIDHMDQRMDKRLVFAPHIIYGNIQEIKGKTIRLIKKTQPIQHVN